MTKTAVLGGDCFWYTEAVLLQLIGVSKETSGYVTGIQKTLTTNQ
jgi:peptide methionine sulfoxide reductase MsrA